MDLRKQEVTRLLRNADAGSPGATALFQAIYQELHSLASRRMARERSGHTLQATALVHEAYLRLVDQTEMVWDNRRHFFGAAAKAMERLLIDHARKARSLKRGGGQARVAITLSGLADEQDPERILALHQALERLAEEDPRAAEIARLRFSAGMETEETARSLEISPRTVARDWAYARARLFELMQPRGDSQDQNP
ncbi:MAG: RNA polymerase subunit sigma-70 [Planctomycetota bacterium]|nr:MAG: RNA polymerase subunit sigma-70 [Planctomycetota bacterium]